jgi:hypothetical protein
MIAIFAEAANQRTDNTTAKTKSTKVQNTAQNAID